MRVIRQVRQMAQTAQSLRRNGKTIGFVPTMGALHDGHLSLIRAAGRASDVVVTSIFVNPLQFGPSEDYERYPRDLKRDLKLAEAAGSDLVFAPDAAQLYPAGCCTRVQVVGLSERFEGAIRPGHFRGVATVVTKLLLIVQPGVAFFGQKDYQQTLVIDRMVRDLNIPVKISMRPTLRESDGLAMSSRNAYLSADQRRRAAALYRALRQAKADILAGERDASVIGKAGRRRLRQESGIRVDYFAAVSAKDLSDLARLRGRVAVLGAIRVGPTRLIDNILVDVP
jgi:pantoate--beta-alanine ligase